MSCLSTPWTVLAVPELLKNADCQSDVESTVAAEHSDIETVEDSCPSELPSPRSSGTADACDEEEGPCNVVVRSTFIDVDDGRSLMQSYRQLRRAMTDSVLAGAFAEEEAYEPGRFSDEHAKVQEAANAPCAPVAAEPVPQATETRTETRTEKDSAKRTTPERTTLMLRNIPNNYCREMFLALLDEHGFAGRYDFVYLPCDFYRQANLGYAFVNLVDGAAVDELWQAFDGFSGWSLPTAKVCQVSWSGPHQGFKAGLGERVHRFLAFRLTALRLCGVACVLHPCPGTRRALQEQPCDASQRARRVQARHLQERCSQELPTTDQEGQSTNCRLLRSSEALQTLALRLRHNCAALTG